MSVRKSLNDVLSNDRTVARGGRILKSTLDDWPEDAMANSNWLSASVSSTKSGSSFNSHDKYTYDKCAYSHPALKIGDTGFVIYGGACSHPIVTDADVYIGFDTGMKFTERSYPWKKGTEFLFKIVDMDVPEKPEEFKKLLKWTASALQAGQKIHCGCIGGHGRTGTFLAALVKEMTGNEDAITYVRENYCKKAVESDKQVKFLNEHFGIKKVAGYKAGGSVSSFSSSGKKGGKDKGKGLTVVSPSHARDFHPMAASNIGSIWDPPYDR